MFLHDDWNQKSVRSVADVSVCSSLRWLETRRRDRTVTAHVRVWRSDICPWICWTWDRRWKWSFWGRNTRPRSVRNRWCSQNPAEHDYRRRREIESWRVEEELLSSLIRISNTNTEQNLIQFWCFSPHVYTNMSYTSLFICITFCLSFYSSIWRNKGYIWFVRDAQTGSCDRSKGNELKLDILQM